jgi:hypothetical protein
MQHVDEMVQLADAIALRDEMGGMSIPVQHEGWDLAGQMKTRPVYPQNEDA